MVVPVESSSTGKYFNSLLDNDLINKSFNFFFATKFINPPPPAPDNFPPNAPFFFAKL